MMAAQRLSDGVPLRCLLDGIVGCEDRVEITRLTLDSREAAPGGLFIACRGERVDRGRYIERALAAGAAAVLAEADFVPRRSYPVPVLRVPALREKIGLIASRFHGDPSARQQVVGITGTNGKSTVAWQLSHALTLGGRPTAMLGTLGYGLPGALREAGLTTPDAITVQALLGTWAGRARGTVMEVSSHALAQSRVNAVRFDTAVLTQLSRDHLDYHKDMAAYIDAKFRLFQMPGLRHAVLNLDDEQGRAWLQRLAGGGVQLCGYTRRRELLRRYGARCPIVHGVAHPAGGRRMSLDTPWGRGCLRNPCIGAFNEENLLASVAVLGLSGVPVEESVSLLARCPPVPGRMETFGGTGGRPLLVVDYAHTPDALRQALQALRPLAAGRLICVFGCGGERDRGKRRQMGDIAGRFADQVIVTHDNPRREKPGRIVDDILSGLPDPARVSVITERAAAIGVAFERAAASDVVLIAGKGHETRQQLRDRCVPCDDRALAKALCGEGGE